MTNPAWTPLVSAACAKPESPNSATSAGTTAEAENHSAIAATWHTAMIATDALFDPATVDIAASAIRQRHIFGSVTPF